MQTTKQRVRLIARQYYQNVAKLNLDDSKITVSIMQSLSNQVYKVSLNGNNDILIKMYQRGLPQFSDTTLEARLVKYLSEQRFYPEVLFETEQYRIERFINSVKIAQDNFSESVVLRIVTILAQYSCNYRQFVMEYISENDIRQKYSLNELQAVFQKIYLRKKIQCPELVARCEECFDRTFRNEKAMKHMLTLLADTERVLCHNDVHLGNVLVEQNQNVFLIDFEFTQFNYVGYDLGNFLNEWATHYGTNTFQIRQDWEMSEDLKEKVIKSYFTSLKLGFVFRNKPEDWRRYVQIGRVLSHLLWLIIGFRQIDDKRVSIDIVYYVKRRSEEFVKQFNVLQAMMRNNL